MRRDIHAPARRVDAEPAQRARDGGLLGRDGDVEHARRRVHASLLGERREGLGERGEEAAEIGRAQTEVIAGEERLVGALPVVGEALAVCASQLDVAPERGSEGGEVVMLAGHPPALLALRAGPRQLDRELRRYPARSLPVAAGDAHDVVLDLAQLGAFELREPLSDLLPRRQLVSQPRERAELQRARRPPLAGHRHLGIPLGEHLHGGQVGELGEALP